MTKTAQNFDYWTGTEQNLIYTITDANAASVDMDGASAWWLLQDEPDSGSLILLKTGGSGVAVSGCTVTVAIPASLTAGCALEGTYYAELSACDTSGNADILAVGYANIHRRGR